MATSEEFHVAANKNDLAAVKLMLAASPDLVDKADDARFSALMNAAQRGANGWCNNSRKLLQWISKVLVDRDGSAALTSPCIG